MLISKSLLHISASFCIELVLIPIATIVAVSAVLVLVPTALIIVPSAPWLASALLVAPIVVVLVVLAIGLLVVSPHLPVAIHRILLLTIHGIALFIPLLSILLTELVVLLLVILEGTLGLVLSISWILLSKHFIAFIGTCTVI